MTTETITGNNTSLFNLKTGEIKPYFQKQLSLVGLVAARHFEEVDNFHIKNVNYLLQNNGCFQRDCDFYKNDGKSSFNISYNQAVNFLNHDYENREILLPREKKAVDAIFPCGVEPTMHKRFTSLKIALENGYAFKKIHFIAKDENTKKSVLNLLENDYKTLISGIEFSITVTNTEIDIFKRGLELIESDLSNDFSIISDPTFAAKAESFASAILQSKNCIGVASVPVKDWNKEMELYDYHTNILGSKEKAIIAFAKSAWNFKARQVHAELQVYKSQQL